MRNQEPGGSGSKASPPRFSRFHAKRGKLIPLKGQFCDRHDPVPLGSAWGLSLPLGKGLPLSAPPAPARRPGGPTWPLVGGGISSPLELMRTWALSEEVPMPDSLCSGPCTWFRLKVTQGGPPRSTRGFPQRTQGAAGSLPPPGNSQ